ASASWAGNSDETCVRRYGLYEFQRRLRQYRYCGPDHPHGRYPAEWKVRAPRRHFPVQAAIPQAARQIRYPLRNTPYSAAVAAREDPPVPRSQPHSCRAATPSGYTQRTFQLFNILTQFTNRRPRILNLTPVLADGNHSTSDHQFM